MKQFIMRKAIICLFVFCLTIGTANAETCSSVTKGDVTWTFQSDVTCGQFVNGDWWVVAPVTITRIEPDYYVYGEGTCYEHRRNGWQVNPPFDSTLVLGDRCDDLANRLNTSLLPELPYAASAGDSIVKAIATTGMINESTCAETNSKNYCISRAEVLTVLSEAPANAGATIFRPPYVSTTKPLFSTSSLQTNLLPSLATTATINSAKPSIDCGVTYFDNGVFLDHSDWANIRDGQRPTAFGDMTYSPHIGKLVAQTILRLSLNDATLSEKNSSIIALTQFAIDQYYIHLAGQDYRRGSGITPGHVVAAAWFAFIFDDATAQSNLSTWVNARPYATAKYDTARKISTLISDSDFGLYSFYSSAGWTDFRETTYWERLIANSAGTTNFPDPYQFIDGDITLNTYNAYLPIYTSTILNETFAMRFLYGVREFLSFEPIFTFGLRAGSTGMHTQPDPCAPTTQGSYGVAGGHGPCPSPIGDAVCSSGTFKCLLDEDVDYYNSDTDWACRDGGTCGRLPTRHGVSLNSFSSSYSTGFIQAMWDAYWDYTATSPTTIPGGSISGGSISGGSTAQ